ncbi:MAG: hypothetical protein D6812_10575, partial [Deltaproteobacteria bacterium]
MESLSLFERRRWKGGNMQHKDEIMRKHFGILVGVGMLVLALSPVPSQAGIKVAVWEESFASGSTGYNTVNADPIVELLNDG